MEGPNSATPYGARDAMFPKGQNGNLPLLDRLLGYISPRCARETQVLPTMMLSRGGLILRKGKMS